MVTAANVSAVGTIGLTVAGGYFFGPAGAAAGAVLGSFLFGASGPDIEGPRLGDTSVAASTYGNVIPVAFGVQKLAGSMIWATDIIEDKNTRKEGDGIFGGGQKITEYRYYANFAVVFAEGPCTGLLRLWAGEKLLADLQAPDLAGGGTDTLAGAMRYFVRGKRYKFRFYRGTSDQEPDPLIVKNIDKEVGANATPAFRDLVYLVFERLPLDEFGNRIPPITAEIAWTQIDEQPIRALEFLAGGGIFAANTFQLGSGMLHERRHRFYVRTTSSPGGIRRFNLLTGKEDFQVPYGTAMDPDGGTGWETGTYDLDGNVYLAADGGSDIIKADGDSLTHIERLESALFGYSDMDCGHAFTLGGFVPILFCATTLGSMRIVRADAPMALIHTGSAMNRIGGVVRGSEATLGQVEGWYASRGFPTPGATIVLRRYTVSASAQAGAGISYRDYAIAAADVGGTTDISVGNLAYDETDDSIIFIASTDGASVGFLVKFSPEDGIVWVNSEVDWSTYSIPRKAKLTQGRIALWESGSTSTQIHLVDTETGKIVQTQTGWDSQGGNNLFYDANIQMLVNAHGNGIHQAWPGRATRDTVPLSEVVTDLCARVGLTADDIDVAQLADPVRGFSLARQVSIRGGLELLAVAYNFDGVESDGQLKFTKRGSSSIRVITQDELAYVSDPDSPVPELFGETRAQDVDLPARFTVRYNDIERDSDIGVQTVKRIVRPAATMQSQNEAILDLPLVLSSEEAKEIALRQGFSPWIERVHHQWRLPWTHIDIDPGDVVTVALDDGRAFEVRVLKVDIGANLELAWDTVVQESSTYDVAALTSGGLTYRRAFVAPTPETRLLLADSPLLADGDDAERLSSGMYWAIGGIGQPGWSGGVLFESVDGAAFYVVDESTVEMRWGVCRAALGDTATPFQSDRVNTIEVTMTAGTPGSVTELEMLNGENRALIIDPDGAVEVIAWANATHEGGASRTYTLHTLLRGLRGTESCTGGHQIGSMFLALDQAVFRRLIPLADLGAQKTYKAVGRGGVLAEAPRRTITPAGRDLMPYAPVHLQSNGNAWGSNITLSWVRRTRLGGEWVDAFETVPVAEDDEAYELEILEGPGGTVLRTATGITSASFVYTAAMQSADFGTAQTELTFRVYQISAQVGRGFPSEDTTVSTA